MKKNNFYIVLSVVVFSVAMIIFAGASFVDVPENAYYAEAANRMNEMGILTGYGDGHYNGDENITRAQMAVVAVRLLGKEEEAKKLAGETVFDDFTPAHDWATGYVNFAVSEKIIVGDGDGNFRPDDPVKYEEVVKTIVCVLGLDEGVKIVPGDWSKEYIEAAKKANLLNGLIGQKGEPMKRSDIAVICSSSIDALNGVPSETAGETTFKNDDKPKLPSSGNDKDESAETTTSSTVVETERVPAETETTTRIPSRVETLPERD